MDPDTAAIRLSPRGYEAPLETDLNAMMFPEVRSMAVSLEKLSRMVSHALRHEPAKYGLELDPDGWVSVASLLAAVHRQGTAWAGVTSDDFGLMIDQSVKKRHELDGGRIRARYGHSLPGRIEMEQLVPPAQLFHGTSPGAWEAIRTEGLRPMQRQYVHLAMNVADALAVGRRKSPEPIILQVDTVGAAMAGTRFALGNDTIWLADFIGPDHVALQGAP